MQTNKKQLMTFISKDNNNKQMKKHDSTQLSKA